MSIHVMIADDHAMIREGIRRLIEFEGNMKVVAEAGDGEECIAELQHTDVDVLLLDINMPKLNGLQVLKLLRDSKRKIKVLILTVHNEIDYLVKAIDIGVDGYLLKNSESDDLKRAITAVYNGETFIQPDLIPALNLRLVSRDETKDKLDSLTRREYDVLICVAKGMFNKEIADTLDISERTVKNHISNIFKKIDVVDRTQAAIFAIKCGIVEI